MEGGFLGGGGGEVVGVEGFVARQVDAGAWGLGGARGEARVLGGEERGERGVVRGWDGWVECGGGGGVELGGDEGGGRGVGGVGERGVDVCVPVG